MPLPSSIIPSPIFRSRRLCHRSGVATKSFLSTYEVASAVCDNMLLVGENVGAFTAPVGILRRREVHMQQFKVCSKAAVHGFGSERGGRILLSNSICRLQWGTVT